MLELPDRWVWDFWHVRDDDGLEHLFFLSAPRSLAEEGLRHWHVTIGHATSTDLVDWTVHDDAFGPGPEGAFDDYTTWTGSIVRHDGRWRMLYTATNRAEDGKVQRVGLATSDDLSTWERHPEPVLEADPGFYEKLDLDAWHDEAWRDPWVFEGPDGWWHCYLTARLPGHLVDARPRSRGVVGHARSRDLVTWEQLPPVTAPMDLGQLEVPQLVELGGRWHLLFCSDVETQDARARIELPGTGTFHLVADDPLGPFDGPPRPLEVDWPACTYAGRIIEDADGVPWFLAWERADQDHGFVGRITDPRRVEVGDDGALTLGPTRRSDRD